MSSKFEITNIFPPQQYQTYQTTQTQKNIKYKSPTQTPQVFLITFTNQQYQVSIMQDLNTAYLISLGFYCKGTTGCEHIRVSLAEKNAEVRVAASVYDLMKLGLNQGNPGGVFPFVTKYDSLNMEYAAIAAPTADVPLNGAILYLDVPSASQAGVPVGTKAYVELAYLFKIIEG